MPELPEVETVRRGLAEHITGATIARVEVFETRSIRQHRQGARDFERRLEGVRIDCVSRRGKFLWMPLSRAGEDGDEALVMHLGMSGQALLLPADAPDEKHLRVRMAIAGSDLQLRFVDQRMFGGMYIDDLVAVENASHRGIERMPERVMHIARDIMDPSIDDAALVAAIRGRSAGIKSVLLNQEVVSGIGNIYADEALWHAKVHYATPAFRLSAARVRELLAAVRTVMAAAIEAGGTSFDDLYVGVNGESGWFDVSLNAYGQEALPCKRCTRPIVRESWSNRSSYRCPRCQRTPRAM